MPFGLPTTTIGGQQIQLGGNPGGFLSRLTGLGAPAVGGAPPPLPGQGPTAVPGGPGTSTASTGGPVAPPTLAPPTVPGGGVTGATPGAGQFLPTQGVPNPFGNTPTANPIASPQGAAFLLQQLQAAGINPGVNPNAGFAFTGSGANFRGNVLDANSGPFQGGPFGLPGREADATAGLVANLLLAQAQGQQPRSDQRNALLAGNIESLAASPAQTAANSAIENALRLMQEAGGDDRRALLVDQATRNATRQKNDASNRLRDLGFFGQGGPTADVALQLENQSARNFGDALFDIENQLFQDRASATDLLSQQAGRATDVNQDLQRALFGFADTLGRADNAATGELINFLGQLPALQTNQALSLRGGSFFDEASPLLSAIAQATGAALGG